MRGVGPGRVHRGRGGGPSLMLNAQVDVVPPGDLDSWQDADPFSGAVDAAAVRGRGACNMNGGLVASWWAVRALIDLGVQLRGDLLLAAGSGGRGRRPRHIRDLGPGWRADACVIPEPTSLDLVPTNAGSLTVRLMVTGLAAHASRRQAGASAVERFRSSGAPRARGAATHRGRAADIAVRPRLPHRGGQGVVRQLGVLRARRARSRRTLRGPPG